MDVQEFESNKSQIQQMISIINSKKDLADNKKKEILNYLEEFECWHPFFQLIKKVLNSFAPDESKKEYFIRLAKVQNKYLDDVFSASTTCIDAIKTLKLSYEQFNQIFISNIIEENDFLNEANLLNSCVDHFSNTKDKIACYERLCLIHEKKLNDKTQLTEKYDQLLELDAFNQKALRYFKLMYMQNFEWEEVVEILKKLIESSRHPQDLFRQAQELAGVYLYQMDKPYDAIKVIENYCDESHLDTSTIHFDAYHRLGDWNGCLKVLRRSLIDLNNEKQRAIIHFKIGELEEKQGRIDGAQKEYLKAFELSSDFFEPIENLIKLYTDNKKWDHVIRTLELLVKHVDSKDLKDRILEAIKRLKDSLVNDK